MLENKNKSIETKQRATSGTKHKEKSKANMWSTKCLNTFNKRQHCYLGLP